MGVEAAQAMVFNLDQALSEPEHQDCTYVASERADSKDSSWPGVWALINTMNRSNLVTFEGYFHL